MDSGGGAHGETPLLCRKGNSAAPESQGDLSGPEETHTSRGGVVVTFNTIENTWIDTNTHTHSCFVTSFVASSPQMQSLCSSEDAMALLDHMETQYYELQLQLYDIQAEILQCEELLLTAQLDSIRRQMTGILAKFTCYFWANFAYRISPCVYVCVFSERQDEVVYYDTFESADDITEDDTAEREELHRLQVSARQLEARRGRIAAKRSYLRNKRVCMPYLHPHLLSLLNPLLYSTNCIHYIL